jgi:hypothetical protein
MIHPKLLRVGYRFASPTTLRMPVGAADAVREHEQMEAPLLVGGEKD